MPFNGSGNFAPPSSVFPIVNGTAGDATQVDTIISDLASGLSNCVTKDGQTTVASNIPMNGFKFTGMAAGSNRTDTATIANIQDGTGVYVTSVSGTENAIILSPTPAIAAYATGQCFRFAVPSTNTSSVTVAISGLTAKPIQTSNGVECIAGDLPQNQIVEIYYDASMATSGGFLVAGGGEATNRSNKTITSCNLVQCTVSADPIIDSGIPSKSYVDALWTTGDVKVTLRSTADSGWVVFDDGTIGSASSAATTRANADTEDLFTLLWNNTTDANCAVSSGRGSSAAADFAANKTIALPKVLGRALAVAGAGSGLTSRALAQALGSEDAITVSHTHTASQSAHSHTYSVTTAGSGAFTDTVAAGGISGGAGGGPTATATPAITVTSTGSSGTGANMPPSIHFYVHVKL